MNSNNSISSNSSINAAALQNELIRKLKLNTSSNSINKNRTIKPSSSSSSSIARRTTSTNTIKCSSCNNVSTNTTICTTCGFFLKSLHQPIDTLAQRLGLVKGPTTSSTITRTQWDTLEKKLKEPNHVLDKNCPICMEPFNQGTEVLLLLTTYLY